MSASALKQILHLSLGVLTVALVVRTWFVMGLIEPVIVSGSSMAPQLRGPHITVRCMRCGNQFDIGAEFQQPRIECLRCGYAKNTGEGLPIAQGDSLVVDRTAFELRPPSRWETVVLRSPDDGQLAVKRIVGLPGETIQLRDGDIWINGQIATKSLADMRALRQLIHEESPEFRRWQASDEGACCWSSEAWCISARDGAELSLAYRHLLGGNITNDSTYNAGLTRRIFPARDLALSAHVCSAGDWYMSLQMDDGGLPLAVSIEGSGDMLLEAFAFDRRVQVFLDGRLYDERELDRAASSEPTASPIYLGVLQSHVAIRNLRIYCDIYHASEAEQIGSTSPMRPVKLGPDEVYVLGDNEAVSIDSRRWGPVPVRLLVGKPIGVR